MSNDIRSGGGVGGYALLVIAGALIILTALAWGAGML